MITACETPRHSKNGTDSIGGYWGGLALLSCFLLGLLSGYGAAAWNKPSLLFAGIKTLYGAPLMPAVASPAEPVSWRRDFTTKKIASER